MNWSLIIFGLVALSSVTFAKNSYLVIAPKLLKVNYDNQLSVFIASASQPVEVKFTLTLGQKHLEAKTICKAGETRNATLPLPREFPIGAGELIITGTGGLQFEEKRDVIIYDNRHLLLVQTSASTYRPRDTMEIRVVATTEELMPMESGELKVEIYDAALRLVGDFPRVPIRSGLTETLRFPISDDVNAGSWLVSSTLGNTTSSVEVLVTRPITPSFDLKAMFQRFLLRTDRMLRGTIEIASDQNEPIFGRAMIAIGQITEQEVESRMKSAPTQEEQSKNEEWRKWKSQQFEIAGRMELNYDLLSMFNVDISKAIAVQVYIQVVDLMSGQERIIRHVIPIFTRDILYDIRPLQFEAGIKNEYEIIARRPDGKPIKMEDVIVTVRMILGDEHGKQQDEKLVEIKDFYTRGRNDMGFFNIDFPENCMGVMMTITPMSEDGKVRGYRTHSLPLLPTPRGNGAKLSIELLPSKVAPVNTDVNVPVVSSQISTVGRTSMFHVQLMPSKPIEKFERLPMSYVLMTNGRITHTGEFHLEPTKECQTKTVRSIRPDEQMPPACVFNGTLPIHITRDMVPYSTLLVYTFQPSFGFNVAETYRFSVAGLFQNSLTLNATIVPFTSTETIVDDARFLKEMHLKPIRISDKVQDKTRVELSFTGVPDSTVGLNVFEYDGILQGLANEITKERLLRYLTTYEHVPIVGMPTMPVAEASVRRQRQSGPNPDMGGPQGGMSGFSNGPNSGAQGGMYGSPNGPNSGAQGGMSGYPNGPNSGAQGGMYGSPNGPNSGAQGGMSGYPNGPNSGAQGDMSGSPNGPNSNAQGGMFGSANGPSGGVPSMNGNPSQSESSMNGPSGMSHASEEEPVRRTISEQDEENQISREQMGYKIRYPVEKMAFGVNKLHTLPTVEGDDIYVPSNMGRLYGDVQDQPSSSHYRRKSESSSMNQYDVDLNGNDYVVATSIPLVFAAGSSPKPMSPKSEEDKKMNVKENQSEESMNKYSSEHRTSSWYERMHSRLNSFSQEAFKFMQSGLTIVSDFESLQVPVEMKHENFTKLFNKFRTQSSKYMERQPFTIRDEARELLEEYIAESDLSMIVPPIMIEEQARIGYYRSVFFNTSRIESQGTGKVVLPRTKPYYTWLATGFALNAKSGLSIAQPIRLPTNQGLFVLGDCPKLARVGEHILLNYGINNYLGKDLTNVILRIRASADFDLIEQSKPEEIISSKDKDYTLTIPSMKSLGVEIRNLVLIPKRAGLIRIVIEVESEFGGDYEVLTMFVREAGIQRLEMTARLFDLTSDKKSYGPIVEKFTESADLRAVRLSVSGTFFDRFVKRYTSETKSLVGIDRSLINLYRALTARRYLNETLQTDTLFYNMTADNITTAYQSLQHYGNYNGSYSFVSDEGTHHSSLYYTSLAFGAMISPMMPFRDNVTLNRTLTWILSHQQEDGSFEDNCPCFHYRFCAGEFRRESMTAIVLYSLTRENSTDYMPEFLRRRFFDGENSPMMRAQRYLVSRVSAVKPHLLTINLFEMTFIQNRNISAELREKIRETLMARKLTVVPEDGSKYLKNVDDKMTFDDQLLVNAMTTSLYTSFGDFRTASDITRWTVNQMEIHPHFDTILDAIFQIEAWYRFDCLFRQQFDMEKVDLTVDVAGDNGEKKQFKINSENLDLSQYFEFTSPVRQITYSVNGFGLVGVLIARVYSEKQQPKLLKPNPFQLSQEFKPMPWFSEISAKTCMTYTPTKETQRLATDNFNRTMVIEIQLPSGTRINERQIGFFLSRVEFVMYYTYEPCGNKLNFFVTVPSTMYGKPICMNWCLERLSSVVTWAPIEVRVYDYLQPETEFVLLVPIQFQPALLGYSFIDAVHKARPTLQSLPLLQKGKQI